jgi:hypothetical protein
LSEGSVAIALGVSTCPSPDPIDASIERKLQDAEAALLHSNDAATRVIVRSNHGYLRRAEALSRFIFECPSVF